MQDLLRSALAVQCHHSITAELLGEKWWAGGLGQVVEGKAGGKLWRGNSAEEQSRKGGGRSIWKIEDACNFEAELSEGAQFSQLKAVQQWQIY